MFKNSFKIAWRKLIGDRMFTLLNLIGLSTGLACTFLIGLWIDHEVSIDSFQDKGLYEVMKNITLADKSLITRTTTPDLLAKALKEEVPGIADAVTLKLPDFDEETAVISNGANSSFRVSEAFATGNFFRLFNFKLLQGDPKALSGVNGIFLSDKLAGKMFHSPGNAIGKTITWYKGLHEKINGTYEVTGVFAAPPANSSLQFDVIFPHQQYVRTSGQDINWNSSDPGTYVVLNKGVSPDQISRQIRNFIAKKVGNPEWAGTLFLQRFKDIYLHNHYENGQVAGGRIEYIRLFSIMAIFLLAIACINFMNLSTAKASARLKEVGIKKVMGASRGLLIAQYLGESLLMAFAAMVVAAGLVLLALPYFERLTGADLWSAFDPAILIAVLAITLITGLLAGSYPALFLSGFKPSLILKGSLNFRPGGTGIRKALVVFQFCISAVLIISVLTIYRQMQFIQTRNLGYNKNDIISFKNDGNIQKNLGAFLTDMRNIAGVVNVSAVEGDLLGNYSGGGGIDWPGKTAKIEFSGVYADFNFSQTMGVQMKEGRAFSEATPADSNAVIFNETAIREMDLKDPVGKTVKLWGAPKTIIGVVKDFHYESLYKKIGPFFISYLRNGEGIVARISPGAERETLARIADLYHTYNHGLPFEYKFMDEDYHALYAAEERVSALSKWVAGIAILISCLGLFGVAAFVVQRRQKEIGIRKVVGASVSHLTTLLSADFIKLVLIAFVVAVPIAWWALTRWLQDFAYHVSIGYETFLIPGAAILLIALVTVSSQTVKGAMANPVKSLRSE